jgi:cytochrome c peroxidase
MAEKCGGVDVMAKLIRLLFVTTIVLAGLGAPSHAQTAGWTDVPQGWSQDQRIAWWTATQGSRLIPRAWLDALEQPDSTAMFLDPANIEKFRYLPNPTAGWASPDRNCPYDPAIPLGFAVDCQSDANLSNTKLRWKAGQSDNEPWVGMNCSACHTAELTYNGTRMRVDGAPTLADFQTFLESLNKALLQTADSKDPSKFNRFANRVLGPNASATDTGMLLSALTQLNKWNSALASLNNPGGLRYGYGRLDAIGHIFNKVALIANPTDVAHQNANPSDAPVSYPFLWNVPQLNKVEWNASAPNIDLNDLRAGAMVRNTGEVIGVFADIVIRNKPGLLQGYTSSINLPNLVKMETQLTTLQPPAWPTALPPINQDLAKTGAGLFQAQCASCHTVPSSRANLTEKYTVNVQPILAGSDPTNTDFWMACNAILDWANTGLFRGNPTQLVNSTTFGPTSDSFSMTGNAALGALLDKKGDLVVSSFQGIFGFSRGLPLPRKIYQAGLTPKQARAAACKAFQDDPTNPKMVYKGRPLQGIWATAPYLHNGSVANLRELLLPPAKRMTSFYVGTREFDPTNVGLRTDAAAPGNAFLFRTQDDKGAPIDGNANTGHDYGNARLQEPDILALIEYMKTL